MMNDELAMLDDEQLETNNQSQSSNPKADLRFRTKAFALQIIRLYSSLPRTTEAQVLGRQLLRSGTSVGAHYSEARRARSSPEFVSKIEGGLQELEETVYWLELLQEAKLSRPGITHDLLREADELISIFVSSAKTAKRSA
jgi:four helix bundle protein